MLYYPLSVLRYTSSIPIPLLDYKQSDDWEELTEEIRLQHSNRIFYLEVRTDAELEIACKNISSRIAEFT